MKQMVIVLAIAAWVLLPTDVQAQEDWEQPGVWVTAGGGYGSVQTNCVRCSVPRHNSFAFLAGVGGSASKKVRFGVEAVGWFQSAADTSRDYFGVLALTQFFPFESLPFSAQIGVGGGRYAEEGAGDVLEAFGFAISFGAAYDYRFARGFDARLFVRYLFSNGLTIRVNRQVQFTDLNYNMLYLGVALVWTKY